MKNWNEYLQYLHRAFASCQETVVHLGILYDTKSFADEELFKKLSDKYDHLGKMLFRFIEAVHNDHLSPTYVKESEADYRS